MRILGVDPGSRVTGYGVIDSDGQKSRAVDSGCIRLGGGDLSGRLDRLFLDLNTVIEQWQPQVVAIESVFVSRSPASALILGHARGVAIVSATQNRLMVYEYAPRAIKQAVVGTGRAEKAQVQHMIKMLLGLSQIPATDAADALAVALCHAHTMGIRSYGLGRSS